MEFQSVLPFDHMVYVIEGITYHLQQHLTYLLFCIPANGVNLDDHAYTAARAYTAAC